jgi:hypothetical protein
MFRRPMARLAVTAVAAGTICALGASVASAAPQSSWSHQRLVPGAITNDSPTVSSITFPGAHGQGQIVGWRGRQSSGPIFYKFKVAGLNKGGWSKTGRVPGSTSSAPAFASYRDPLGNWAVLAVWTGPADHHILFSQGETKANGTISWTKATVLPSKVADTNTSSGPSVLFPNHTYKVIISWRGPANHVRFTIGTPFRRGFTFSGSRIVPGPHITKTCDAAPCTSGTPALAEVNDGTVFFFWHELGTKAILFGTVADTAAGLSKPAFRGEVPGAATLESPAASDIGINGFNSLLLAYKAPLSIAVHFQTLTKNGWSKPATVPGTHTATAPALLLNELATTTPATDGNIVLHHFIP